MDKNLCQEEGCNNPVSKAGFKLCLNCWKKKNPKKDSQQNLKSKDDNVALSASKIAERFGIKATRLNAILNELGWLERAPKGWKVTTAGASMNAIQSTFKATGVPYVLWPESILNNQILQEAISNYLGNESSQPKETSQDLNDFRNKFPATFRATDGHWVRSRAEVMIDNYLYNSLLVHAYERKLPIEEDIYCDFYLPQKKVCIEYWGLENDAKYAARKKQKLEIYKKYKDRYNLLELGDEEIGNLDDHLPRLLLKFDIAVD